MSVSDGATPAAGGEAGEGHHGLGALTLGAVGVVYGDIGTSPIYALREAIKAVSGERAATEAEVLGVLSIILWSLTLIVSIKYAIFVLRADNRGEGGTLSIMALARQRAGPAAPFVLLLGMLGAAMFFGDAVITPAISVLSAVEGLKVAAPALSDYVLPLTVLILVLLFSVQRYGTARVAGVFGPITAIWFLVLGLIGAMHISDDPHVLFAVNPLRAASFLVTHTGVALAVMGAAFLAVTGAEALYADLGHFGRRPIVLAWFCLVFPCLLLNYFGQGAFLLAHEGIVEQPLFEMVPGWATLPLVLLATAATVIASQAVITGAFSLARQAIQLQLLPRLGVLHTSETQSGQIYMPQVNFMLLAGVLLLVLGFGSSTALATAYGISVSGEALVTTLLLFVVIWRCWTWPVWLALVIVMPFLVLDSVFFWANARKFLDGGWASLLVAGTVLAIMAIWMRGSANLLQKTAKSDMPLAALAQKLVEKRMTTVPGSAVFLTSDPVSAPTALLHSLKHYKVLHEQNVVLTVVTAEQPHVDLDERVKMEMINDLFMRVTLTFGYMEQPNIPQALVVCRKQGWKFDIMNTSFFLSRRSLKPLRKPTLRAWLDRIFIALARNASDATEYYRIPTGRVVEIGTQVTV